MVKLTRIYTRGGDGGQTSLGDGARVAKHDPRVAAYGTVDETNATIGLVRLHTEGALDAMLGRVQNDLFDLGADLCRPGGGPGGGDPARSALRVSAAQVARLETEIDEVNAKLAPLDSFLLPGGAPAAAALHLARTVSRRAEREITALSQAETLNPEAVRYINRLSDLLFVLARHANGDGARDVLWEPGRNR
jgi:cob(I)alamin adenosyltransferase